VSISSSEQLDRIPARLTRGPERVARDVRHQEVIEASFDRADAYARLGDFDRALEWLDRAATASGGLPPSYRARRARWVRSTAVRPRQADAGAGR
jgi:hypothetical protein